MKGDDALWLGLTAWYMTVLGLCATASPDEGFLGMALHLLPARVHTWLYAPATGLLAWLILHCLDYRGWALGGSLAVSAILSVLFAGFLELAHAWQGSRPPDVAHLGWATLGISMTWAFWALRSRRRMVRTTLPESVIPFRRATGRLRKGSFQ